EPSPKPMNAILRILVRTAVVAVLCAAILPVLASSARADELKEGKIALAAGKLEEASRMFEKAAAQDYAEGRAGVGQVWLRRRNYDKALEQFQLAQRMDANLALAYWGMGEVSRRNEDCTAALPNFQKAVQLDRKFPEAQLGLGDCLTQLRRFDEAVAALI